MKAIRILIFTLILAMMLPLAACGEKVLAPDALAVTRKSTTGETVYFAQKGSNTALQLRLPKEWEVKMEDGVYTLYEGDEVIGTVSLSDEAPNEEMTEAGTKTVEGVEVTTHTGAYKKDGARKAAWYRITHTYKAEGKTVHAVFEIKQAVMDKTAYGWLTKPALKTVRDTISQPSLSLAEGNGKKSVLIVGNSFVGSSAIGHLLSDLIKSGNKTCSVASRSIGYATVTKYATGTDNSDYELFRTRMKNGTYGIVFLCGLYSAEDVSQIETIAALCKQSQTQLVLLPAHNENATHIAAAAATYPDLPLLSWKAAINGYIKDGVAEADLCIDDAHKHSTPLAGYIGAAMIYESLFGEAAPAMPANCNTLSAATAAKLDGHSPKGEIYIAESLIYRLP